MQYRRALIPGGTYFFTVVTARRRKLFSNEEAVEVLRQAFQHVNRKRPFTVNAMAVLPDHLHCIWTLPAADADYPTRWRLIKTWTTRHCPPRLQYGRVPAHPHRTPPTLWQPRYWEHVIRDETDYRQHVEYIHYNPVKHGYVRQPCDWPHSSFRRYVQRGLYPRDWGRTEPVLGEGIGRE